MDSAGCTGKESNCHGPPYPPFDRRPADRTLLNPGAAPQDFQLVYHFALDKDVDASYTVLDGDGHAIGYFPARMNVAGGGQTPSECRVSVGSCSANDTTITYLDPPGTVHDTPAGQVQAQGTVLKQLCCR